MNIDFSENGFKNISQHFLMLRPDQASKFAKLSCIKMERWLGELCSKLKIDVINNTHSKHNR